MNNVAALLQVFEPGGQTARWNFPAAAAGTLPDAPGGLGTPATVTYSFMQALPAYEAAGGHPGFRAFDAPLQEAAKRALAAWAAVCNLQFTEVADAGAGGAIRFGRSDMAAGGFSWYPGHALTLGPDGRIAATTAWEPGGDVWLSNAPDLDAQADGGYGRYALLHEIGHAIGLKHPFEGSAVLPPAETDLSHSVMAYALPANAGLVTVDGTPASYRWTGTGLYPAAPMVDDIAAAQALYGANMATNAGDTRYAWAPGERLLETIWDAGGADVIDARAELLPSSIDLREGQPSSISQRLTEAARRAELPDWATGAPTPGYDGRNNRWIARGVTIENAVGGSGDDLLVGNAADNALAGGPGDDTLAGGGGRDLAALPGLRAETQLLPQADGSWETRGPGGRDILREMETVLFEDGPVSIAQAVWMA